METEEVKELDSMHDAAWHAERRKGIGGSDVHHVLSLEPYGCALRLWHDKRGTENEPQAENAHMLRGHYLEDIISKLYAEKTGRFVGNYMISTPTGERSFMRGNLDSIVYKQKDGEGRHPGVLECKCPARDGFFKIKRNGLPDSWILQMQHYMACTGFKWASIAVLWAEGWEFITFDVERDDALIAMLIEREGAFWRMVENGPSPEKLAPGDRRCNTCPYAKSCWGDEQLIADDPSIIDLTGDSAFEAALRQWREANAIIKDAEALIEEAKGVTLAAMGNHTTATGIGGKVRRWTSSRADIDKAALFKAHPELAGQFEEKTSFDVTRLY